jgi:CubicO group peptidase (beta-lactamase class C family)
MNTRAIENEPVQPAMNDDHVASAASARDRNRAGRSGQSTARRRRIALVALLMAVVLVGTHLASRPGDSDVTPARAGHAAPALAAIDSYVRSEMGAQRIPGLALGIVQGGRITHMRGFGEADSSGRAVSPQTPFIIGSLSKSVTAIAVMQLVEAGKLDLDAPVQRYIPWFGVADERASAEITIRHLLNQTSGLSTKTGRSFQGNGDTSDSALERAVRKLRTVQLTEPVGATHQYSTINYSVLGLVVQTVSGQSYERYVQEHIFGPLRMRHSFTSEADAAPQGLAAGHHYWFGRPAAADLPYNRGLLPAGYLISSAEDMSHYLIAQLNDGRYGGAAVLSPSGMAELQRPAVPTPEAGTSYGMGWFVGPINGIPAVFHQGETFSYHANIVLLPGSDQGVVVLMNAENSVDLFIRGRMGTVAEGVASLLAGREPPAPPSRIGILVAYATLLGAIALQIGGMTRSIAALRRRRVATGRLGWKSRTCLALASNLAWAFLVLVLLPRQLGMPLLTLAQGLPDFAYLLLASGVVALAWGVTRTVWAYVAFHKRGGAEHTAHITWPSSDPLGESR